jgi:hypothetical protein
LNRDPVGRNSWNVGLLVPLVPVPLGNAVPNHIDPYYYNIMLEKKHTFHPTKRNLDILKTYCGIINLEDGYSQIYKVLSLVSFEFTKRNAEVLKRVLEVWKDDFQKDFELKSKMDADEFQKERDGDGNCIFTNVSLLKGFYMQMEFEFELTEDESHINMSSLEAYIEIFHKTSKTYTHIFRINLNKCKNDEWVDTLIKTYYPHSEIYKVLSLLD